MSKHRFITASRYIESLRHHAKRRYAHDYYQWLRSGQQGDSPEYNPAALSYMAAQAVRMNLDTIMQAHGQDAQFDRARLGIIESKYSTEQGATEAERQEAAEIVRAMYPPNWPQCPVCGLPAMDGHITCGGAACREGEQRRAAR